MEEGWDPSTSATLQKVSVFCALSREKERGPFFFTEATCLETHFWTCWETDYYPN
jgi:hypothetical protein